MQLHKNVILEAIALSYFSSLLTMILINGSVSELVVDDEPILRSWLLGKSLSAALYNYPNSINIQIAP